jgi:hypothetical protein
MAVRALIFQFNSSIDGRRKIRPDEAHGIAIGRQSPGTRTGYGPVPARIDKTRHLRSVFADASERD